MKALIHAEAVITETGLEKKAVLIANGKIEALVDQDELDDGVEQIDISGKILMPGFIDVHIHGSQGFDVMDGTPEALAAIRQSVVQTGCTGFLATTMTQSKQDIFRALDVIQAAMMMDPPSHGAKLFGAHLEGPFIHPKAKGAHVESFILRPELEVFKPYLDIIRIITLAPEMDEDHATIKAACSCGIAISLGHTTCNYQQAKAAIQAGAKSVTHLFNAMSPLNHRDPGLVGAALNSDLYTELIADNVHVHPDLYEMVFKLKGADRMVLITDAMKGQCMRPGAFDLGGQKVIVDDTSARLENGVLAGSILTLDKGMRHLLQHSSCDWVDVAKMLSTNPANLIGMDHVGRIKTGCQADLVVIDSNREVDSVYIDGDLRHRRA